MNNQNQFYQFYKSYLYKIAQTIKKGHGLIFVGINAIGKNILAEQIFSTKFNKEFFRNQKIYLVMLNFKDKYPPTPEQIYKYWIAQTSKVLGKKINENEVYNDFSFYSQMSELIKSVRSKERIAFIMLDFHNILNQGEAFFKSLIYLHQFSYGKVSYLVLSEPQILDSNNTWVRLFVQQFTNDKYIFLKTFDRKTMIVDIQRHELMLKTKLMKYKPMIIRYAKGLHGVIGAFCRILAKNPEVSDIRRLIKLAYNDRLCQFWVKEVLDSLPKESVRILKIVSKNRERFKKYTKNIYSKWLVNLGFLKKTGALRYPFMLPFLIQYSSPNPLSVLPIRIIKKKIFLQGEKVKLPKNEFLILQTLFKSKGKIVTYDKLGNILWKNNPDKFSLWAISQIIRRLRKKLSFYSINPQIISSQRGEGYILN